MDLGDVQGLVFFGYRRQAFARFYFCTFVEGAQPKEWLARLFPRVSSASPRERSERVRLNLAFTASGLVRLGLSDATLLEFPVEFAQGMSHPERSQVLGDVGEDAPVHWEVGGPNAPRVDALLLLYCESREELEERHAEQLALFERFGISAPSLETYLPEDEREHFGFAFSVSQPAVKGGPRQGIFRRHPKNPYNPPIELGELLLGYKNGYGRVAPSPSVPVKRLTREPPPYRGRSALDFGKNGTFLVFRKLEQDVEGFLRFAEERAALARATDRSALAQAFAARLIGRWPDGRPLAVAPEPDSFVDDLNRFGYREHDPRGLACPLGAHVRRMNPRDSLGESGKVSLERVARHRLVRRGRLYVERAANGEIRRGLAFLALNASLRRQFEFVQSAWQNGLYCDGPSGERDPLLGGPGGEPSGASEPRVFTLQEAPFRERVVGLPRFVRVRGGAYFFLPSLSALAYLAEE